MSSLENQEYDRGIQSLDSEAKVQFSHLSFSAEVSQTTTQPRLVRGPYLQQGTDFSIIIRWATDAPIQSKVSYGTNPALLSTTVTRSNDYL